MKMTASREGCHRRGLRFSFCQLNSACARRSIYFNVSDLKSNDFFRFNSKTQWQTAKQSFSEFFGRCETPPVSVILECEAREPHTPFLHSPQTFCSNVDCRSCSKKIRLFCSLQWQMTDHVCTPGGDSIYPWVGWYGPASHSLTLFKTNIADFPTLFKTEFRFLIPCLRHAVKSCVAFLLCNHWKFNVPGINARVNGSQY